MNLDHLGDLAGAARIVAIGENNHHIHEFSALRTEILRFLVERKGFTMLGFESGFAEGRFTEEWLRGGPGEVEEVGRAGFTFSLGESAEMHEMLTWLRGHGGVSFAGLDVPSSAGSSLPALTEVRAYLRKVAPEAVSFVDAAIEAVTPYAAVSSGVAPARYGQLDQPQRDAATAALTRLVQHLESLAPVYPEPQIPLHHARGALRLDTYLRELADLTAGTAPKVQSSSRDTYMAQTLRLLDKGERIVLMLHNGHLQRVPIQLMPTAVTPTVGTHLAAAYGNEYFALGVTAGTGTTTGLRPDENARLGFTLYEQQLDEPAPGSAEHALAGREAGFVAEPTGSSIRHAHLFSEVDVSAAFDALAYFPEQRVSESVLAR
ncbi:erythromycin esterase family protein [Amycolatopsis acidicola]|uniref:Erythromycin esterase family protein n=1 Tax=Amycolatopsis acidicola TaxID=2596893 RepID=A0A5N0UNA8_9PSEU|nr:erythromycin esterase family protein [Amycolatopsis acidicola]KAA9152034.1 erythromycin esterase family protein [Amycolatopsis acidicola]